MMVRRLATLSVTISLLTLQGVGSPALNVEGPAIGVGVLDKIVDLRLGETTLGAWSKRLADQIGVKIVAAEEIAARELVSAMHSMNAKQALNVICRVNGWAWELKPGGSLTISPRVPKTPTQISEVPAAIISAIPPDLRRYAGIGIAVNKLPRPPDPREAERVDAIIKSSAPFHERSVVWEIIPKRFSSGASSASTRLFNSIQNELIKEGSLHIERLTPLRQRELGAALYLRILKDVSLSYGLLYDELSPYLQNWDTLEIQRSGDAIRYGAVASTKGGRAFVGGAVAIPKE